MLKTKAPRLKLVHKGLILVTIPLIFGFVFILILESLIQIYRETRNQTMLTIDASRQIYVLNALVQELEDANSPGKPRTIRNADVIYSDLSKGLAKLRLGFDTGKHSPSAERGMVAVDRDWAELQKKHNQGVEFQAALSLLQSDLIDAGRRELIWNANMHVKEVERLMQSVLACGLATSTLLCPLIALYFSQNLSKRLQILIDNSERFANRRDLLPPVEGTDEIASVDQVFRTMAKTVNDAEQAQRDFIAMINHDIRTPLNALHATLLLVSEGVYGSISPEGVQRTLTAQRTADELVNLINQLLDLEKVRSGKLELKWAAINIRSVAEKAVDTIYGFSNFKNIQVDVQNSDEIMVLGDETRIMQVMINLLANAAKFSSEGSKISVSFDNIDNNQVEIGIHDEGPGIPAGMEEVVFNRFSQVSETEDSKFVGSGLGLAICKQIIEAHHGRIGVKHISTGGSVFWFRLRKAEPVNVIPDSELSLHG